MRTNKKTVAVNSHGVRVPHISPEQRLRRSVLSCLLWENEFYQDGKTIASNIHEIANECGSEFISALAIEARKEFHLRHASLWLTLVLVPRGSRIVSKTIQKVISRPDEIAEFLAMYWKNGKKPLSYQMKIGLAASFAQFDEYQLAKWNRDSDIRLRDVMFLTHPKPRKSMESAFKKLANNELEPPDTWEVRLSTGENKKDVFTDLLQRRKLGYIALLRNLRNMIKAGVDADLVKAAIAEPSNNVLPFRFIAAARHAMFYERDLDRAMLKVLKDQTKLVGETIILVDVSTSMKAKLSSKSDLTRIDAACGLAILLSGICDNLRVFSFSRNVVEVPPRLGMALADAIWSSQENWNTMLGKAVTFADNSFDYDRLIVLSDEESSENIFFILTSRQANFPGIRWLKLIVC